MMRFNLRTTCTSVKHDLIRPRVLIGSYNVNNKNDYSQTQHTRYTVDIIFFPL